MWQCHKLPTAFLRVRLNRRRGRALPARVQASNLGEADRDLITDPARRSAASGCAGARAVCVSCPGASASCMTTATCPERARRDTRPHPRDIDPVESLVARRCGVRVAKEAGAKPVNPLTPRAEDGEALIARVPHYILPCADAETVEG